MAAILVQGGAFTDHRGILQFVNEKNPGHYRRFYLITQPETSIVRAWQGHLFEEKGFYAINGSFTIAVVCPQNFLNPADNEAVDYFELTEGEGGFLRVPGGCYTGIKANIANSTLLVLSGLDVEESKKDDYRQPADKWGHWQKLSEQTKKNNKL